MCTCRSRLVRMVVECERVPAPARIGATQLVQDEDVFSSSSTHSSVLFLIAKGEQPMTAMFSNLAGFQRFSIFDLRAVSRLGGCHTVKACHWRLVRTVTRPPAGRFWLNPVLLSRSACQQSGSGLLNLSDRILHFYFLTRGTYMYLAYARLSRRV